MTARWITGDTLEVLRAMPDASVDLVLSSPPFFKLRSYLRPDDPNKAKEIGNEATPGEFLDVLLGIVEECRRVLAPHGSLCLELGDTYAGMGGSGEGPKGGGDNNGSSRVPAGPTRFDGRDVAFGTGAAPRPARTGRDRARASNIGGGEHTRAELAGWPLDKSLCMVPELLRVALSYGFNPLTGRETPKWRCRNVVRWCRPNPPVGALSDKFRPATSDLLIACVGRRRYWDIDAVRTEPTVDPATYSGNGYTKGNLAGIGRVTAMPGNAAGAPPLDWWKISTQGYPGSHYATWPEALLVKPIEVMCPRRVCTVCGKPSERLTTPSLAYSKVLGKSWSERTEGRAKASTGPRTHHNTGAGEFRSLTADRLTTGWTDCGCEGSEDRWRRGIVLDLFAGSGTTLAVAEGMGRDSIGIDLDPRNLDLAIERCGLFLEAAWFPGSFGVAVPE